MLRTSITKLARASPLKPTHLRSFTTSLLRSAEGDTGATRSGGSATGDAFSSRRVANENKYIREKEIESLKKLKEKLAEQRDHLEQLDKHIKEIENGRTGSD